MCVLLNMNEELQRLSTFDTWTNKYVTASALAKAGFYIDKARNVVTCFSCKGMISGWDKGHVPFNVHQENFRHCQFICGLDKTNIPLNSQPTLSDCGSSSNPSKFETCPTVIYTLHCQSVIDDKYVHYMKCSFVYS